MIHIEKGEFVVGNPSLKVVTKTGDYEDTALIEFKDVSSEEELVAGAYQAQFIKYGNLVYQFNDPKDLGVEILKIDPESTHAAASFVRLNAELLRQLNNGSLEPSSLDQAVAEEKINTEEPVEGPVDVVEPEETDEPDDTFPPIDTPTPTTPHIDISTTTTPFIPNNSKKNRKIIDVQKTNVVDDFATDQILPVDKKIDNSSILEEVLEVVSPEVGDVVSSVKRKIAKLKGITPKKLAKKKRRNT